MASTWGISFGTAWGNSWGAVTPTPTPTPTPGGGGFTYPLDARRSKRHASVQKIIKRLAKRQVDDLITDKDREEAYARQLQSELARLDLQYEAIFAAWLAEERAKLIDAEIQRLFAIKRLKDEEEEVLAMLLLM
jgi:hypothetical protein